jgi:hypothetical protein
MVRHAPLVTLAALLAGFPAAPASAAPPTPTPATATGVYWEQSIELQVLGFPVPVQTLRVCLAKGEWEVPPEVENESCRVTDLKRSGARMTWKLTCTDGTTGSGELTYGRDTYQGTMTVRTAGQDVRTAFRGRKVGGDCDVAEEARRLADESQQPHDPTPGAKREPPRGDPGR